MSPSLPDRPSLDHLKKQAYEVQKAAKARGGPMPLADAYHELARGYGFASWPKLKHFVDDLHASASSPAELSDVAAAFIAAVRRGDGPAVRAALARDPSLANARILGDNRLLGVTWEADNPRRPVPQDAGRSSTPLHHAAVNSHVEVAAALIEHGADVNAWGYDNNQGRCTPLVLAAWEGSLDVLELLLQHEADPNLRSGGNGGSALMAALMHKKHQHARALLDAGTVPTIHEAAALGSVERLRGFIEADVSAIDQKDESRGATPLYYAACLDQVEAMAWLRDHGAAIDPRHSGGWTPLLAAGYHAAYKAIRWLIQHGADLTAVTSQAYWRMPARSNLLHMLAQGGHAPAGLVTELISKGVSFDARNDAGQTPLAVAIRHRRAGFARLLLDRGADVGVTVDSRSLVHLAIEHCPELIESLLEHGATLDFAAAVNLGRLNLVEKMLDHDPGLAGANPTGSPPLEWAAWGGQTSIARLLLDRGVRPEQAPTAFVAAIRMNHDEILSLLLDHSQNPASQVNERRLLHIAVSVASTHDNVAMVRRLLDLGADPLARDQDGRTPLDLARMLRATPHDPHGRASVLAVASRLDGVIKVLSEATAAQR